MLRELVKAIDQHLNRHGGSTERPHMFLDMVRHGEIDHTTFWPVLREQWTTFDLIDHEAFQDMFTEHREFWTPPETPLADTMAVYRGQCRTQGLVGLCWTTDEAVATKFSLGYRHMKAPEPIILTRQITKDEVCMAFNSRGESEIVVWNTTQVC